MRTLLALLAALLLVPATASAGAFTGIGWSTRPDGEGSHCTLGQHRACYYNFVTATDSPILTGGVSCGQIFTRVIEVTADIQVDIQACDPAGLRDCTDLVNGTDITATTTSTSPAPEGGVAAGIKVNVDTCTTCEGEVEVVCGGPR